MTHNLDQQVISQVHDWLQQGESCWLCTIVKTYGSSPRPVGSLMALNRHGVIVGSLSGGCVEDDLIQRLLQAEPEQRFPQRLEYGVTAEESERLGLPCGGRLELVVERLLPDYASDHQFDIILEQLESRLCVQRQVDLASGRAKVIAIPEFEPLVINEQRLIHSFGPRYQLLLVGAGQLSKTLAQIAQQFDYRVLVCDPRPSFIEQWDVNGVELIQGMPDDVVRERASDPYSIVITLTHDPRIDDMALMEALTTEAFYVGALGSVRTSDKRRQRLLQLSLTEQQVARLHAPVGLPIGSKTPAEIAVAILAELTACRRRAPLAQADMAVSG